MRRIEAHLQGPECKFSQSQYRRSFSEANARQAEANARFDQQEYRQKVLREMRHARGQYSSKFRMIPEDDDLSFSSS